MYHGKNFIMEKNLKKFGFYVYVNNIDEIALIMCAYRQNSRRYDKDQVQRENPGTGSIAITMTRKDISVSSQLSLDGSRIDTVISQDKTAIEFSKDLRP